MKRLLFTAPFLLVLSLAACSSAEDRREDSSKTEETSTTEAPLVAPAQFEVLQPVLNSRTVTPAAIASWRTYWNNREAVSQEITSNPTVTLSCAALEGNTWGAVVEEDGAKPGPDAVYYGLGSEDGLVECDTEAALLKVDVRSGEPTSEDVNLMEVFVKEAQ